MPRTARRKSSTGIYHVILRGVNRQDIFHQDEDRVRFLQTLDRYRKEVEIKIHGWCLMNNHIHMVIEEGKEELAVTMKRISISFVLYYNRKYSSTGHLFQDRYRSENIESNEYLLTVIRYIHNNPVKAGLVRKPIDWQWSSCKMYYGKEQHLTNLLYDELLLSLFSEDKDIAINRFKEFNELDNEDKCMEDNVVKRLKDEEVRKEIEKIASGINIANIKSLPKAERADIIKRAKEIEGISQRQLARILGVSQTLISLT